MRRLVSIDGRIFASDEARVSAYDRGFLYGDAVFETLRTYDGVPFALREHVVRLARSAARTKMRLPLNEDSICARIEDAFTAARESSLDDGYARAVVTRGTAPLGLDIDLAKEPLLVVFIEPLPPPLAYDRGIRAITVATLRAADGTPASGAKVTNYLASMLALAEAKSMGAQEALLLDARGRVIEGTTSNVFAVRGGVIRTPPEEVGLLAGITRAHVLEAAHVELAELRPADLYDADEVFTTSSIREIVGVTAVDGHTIGAGVVGPETQRIHALFRARVGRKVA